MCTAQLPQQHPKTEPKWPSALAETQQRNGSSGFIRSLIPPFLQKFPVLTIHLIHVTPGEPPSTASSLAQGLVPIAGEGNKGLKWFIKMRRHRCDSGGATGMTFFFDMMHLFSKTVRPTRVPGCVSFVAGPVVCSAGELSPRARGTAVVE